MCLRILLPNPDYSYFKASIVREELMLPRLSSVQKDLSALPAVSYPQNVLQAPSPTPQDWAPSRIV